MPAGRTQVDYTDIDLLAITVKIDNSTITYDATKAGGSASVGLGVTWSADDTVALTADADFVLGKLLEVFSDNFASVQVGGACTLPAGNAATVTKGKKIVGALGAASAKGFVRDSNTAVAAELGRQNGRLWNTADTANLVVWFE